MVMTDKSLKIDFSPITPDKRDLFTKYLWESEGRGCEVSFANMCLWGEQMYAEIDTLI